MAVREVRYALRMSGSSIMTRAGSTALATLVLLSPALWNRFPLLEYDTGGYLARWYEGYLVPSRSTTYGLFAVAGWPLDFWPVVLLQALAAVWIIGLVLRTHRFAVYPVALAATTAGLAATTALPWLASVLLTDIFAGLAVLALHTLAWHSDRISSRERFALVVFIAFAASTHSATYAVLLGLAAIAVIVSWLNAEFVPRAGLLPTTYALVLGAGMLLGANAVIGKRLAWTPGGFGLEFGRMLQDGIVTRYLNDHCPDSRLRLCPYRSELPLDADAFLWGDSVFNTLGRFAGLDDEMRSIVLGSLRDYPLMQLETALRATARQLVKIGTGEGFVDTIAHTYGIIERYMPSVGPQMRAARQQHGEIGFTAINAIDEPIGWASMALLPLIVILGWRAAEFADLGRLAVTCTLALIGNAAFCGVISNPHDRYGSRMVWIAGFAVVLALARAYGFAYKPQSSLRNESASTV